MCVWLIPLTEGGRWDTLTEEGSIPLFHRDPFIGCPLFRLSGLQNPCCLCPTSFPTHLASVIPVTYKDGQQNQVPWEVSPERQATGFRR